VSNPCPQEDILNAFLNRALSRSRLEKVRGHLKGCAACRSKLEALAQDYQRMDEMIRGLPQMQPSPGFDAAFWRKVTDIEDHRRRRFRLDRFLSGWRPLLAAGATAGVVLAFMLFRPGPSIPTVEEILIADHMEMLSDFEIIEHLDLLENWDAIQAMKERG